MARIALTEHAEQRMEERGLTPDAIEAAMTFGREIHTRGITIFAVGRNEVKNALSSSLDISPFEGTHVLCGKDGDVITTYRNYDLRGLRPRNRGRSHRYLRRRTAA